ncbi:MAG TPA: hypothetical protein VGO25_12035 [Rhodanobacteraceae bacterium]|nr:hypothetical protein [Rhodanobacteraceae bacterium]
MSLLCTSFPLDLRRIARSRVARLLVWVLALALPFTNTAMAAMPMAPVSASGSHATVSHPAAHDAHCAGRAMSVPVHAHCAGLAPTAAHAAHAGDGCGCCIGKTCACVQIFDVPAVNALFARVAPASRLFSVLPPRPYAAIEARLLRPPIV